MLELVYITVLEAVARKGLRVRVSLLAPMLECVELVDQADLKSAVLRGVRVRLPPRAPTFNEGLQHEPYE